MSSAGLEIKGLGKRYGNSVIVDDLSLQVRDGDDHGNVCADGADGRRAAIGVTCLAWTWLSRRILSP